jgi:hypothetical protein
VDTAEGETGSGWEGGRHRRLNLRGSCSNELLQQRLDQLGQSQDKPSPAPGAPLSAGSFPRSFLIPDTDTPVRVGGSVTGIVQYGRQ